MHETLFLIFMQNVFRFLRLLKDNNNKVWFDANRKIYEQSKKDFIEFLTDLSGRMVKYDSLFQTVDPKKSIFRINRDIRFSKDKSPYKINFGAYFSPSGKSSFHAGYYLHLQPEDQSFMAGGIYMPPADVLKKIRQEIDYNGEGLKGIISSADFKKTWGTLQQEDKLARPPQGYAADHPDIELLKLKSLTFAHKFSDREAESPEFVQRVTEGFVRLKPFLDFLNGALD